MSRRRVRPTFRNPFRRGGLRHEVDEEFAFHIDEATRALERTGLDPESARRAALAQFGDRTRWRTSALRERRRRWIAATGRARARSAVTDLRGAVLRLARRPVFAAVLCTGSRGRHRLVDRGHLDRRRHDATPPSLRGAGSCGASVRNRTATLPAGRARRRALRRHRRRRDVVLRPFDDGRAIPNDLRRWPEALSGAVGRVELLRRAGGRARTRPPDPARRRGSGRRVGRGRHARLLDGRARGRPHPRWERSFASATEPSRVVGVMPEDFDFPLARRPQLFLPFRGDRTRSRLGRHAHAGRSAP